MATKEGKPREQFLNMPDPETITVIHSEFDGEVMTINADAFDPKKHKRCNIHGQFVDERGVVIAEAESKKA